jgi:branched-chain amino acid transport system permease protein
MKRFLPVVSLAIVVIVIQVLTAIFGVSYYLTQLTMSAYYALVAVGLCLLMGYAGQISLGQAGFFAIGGYTTATLTTQNLAAFADTPFIEFLMSIRLVLTKTNTYGEELFFLNPWLACIAAVLITVVVAFAVGKPVLALRGHYLAMATLGFGTIIYRIVLGSRLFGEADGITNVPGFDVFPGLTISGKMSERIENYYIAWAVVLLGMLALTNLIHSRIGRGLRALHGSEEAADAMGVHTSRLKVRVFVVGALFASVAGILLTHYNGGIGPSEASTAKSVRYVAIVAVGGMANVWGTLIISTVLNFLSLRGAFGSYDDAVFGIVLIAIMLFAPDGFLKVPIVTVVRAKIASYLQKRKAVEVINPLKSDTTGSGDR